MTHYRKPIDFNDNAIHSANKSLIKLGSLIEPFILSYDNDLNACDKAIDEALEKEKAYIYDLVEMLCNDMNTPILLSSLFKIQSPKKLAIICSFLGFKPSILHKHKNSRIDPEILELANEREEAKKERNWTIADAIRNEITARGYSVLDQKEGGFKITKNLC
jgi:cysteinyl-tRNA synthetase